MGAGVLTPAFVPANGSLHCEGVPLEAIAAEAGTPTYVYSAATIRDQYRRLADVFAGVPHRLHYSVKANSNLAVLSLLKELGAGLDIVSGGELFRALRVGFAGADVVFSGVGKTERELGEALAAGVLLINVESEGELLLVDELARARATVAPVGLRINPEVAVDTPHEYTRTGGRGHKFGIALEDARETARLAGRLANVRLVALDMHIGSQIASFQPYAVALERVLGLLDEIRRDGAAFVEFLDVGGGLAVTYDGEAGADVEEFAQGAARAASAARVKLILEPGRFLVANAGVMLTRVLYRKRSGGTHYIVTDAGMNDLVRPSHYQAFHRVEAVTPNGRRTVANIVGPVCESGDFLALDRETDDVVPGDLLAVQSAGAYGFAMASNYNSRGRPAEVLVDGNRWAVVTERETYEDLVRAERAEPVWRVR